MLKIRTASTELTLGAFCCTQHSVKKCRQIAFIGVTHNIYAKEFVLSVRQTTTLRLICLHSMSAKLTISRYGASQIQKRHAGRRACPPPRHARRQERPLAECASSSKTLAGSSDLCAATIKMHRLRHNRTARSAAAHEITPSSRPNTLCCRADTDRTKPAISKPPTLCSTSIESFESGL